MDSHPYRQKPKFVELLTSQQNIVFGLSGDSLDLSSSQVPLFGFQPSEDSNFGDSTPAGHRERRKWTPGDDVLLISSWLNTSKDPVKRVAAYFAASPKVQGYEVREATHCKNRWQKINDLVNKFCGAYEAASRERSSGQNENDILKLAHEIFFNNHQKKFNLEHAWKELRNDQKWCELYTCKAGGSGKRRKLDDGAHSSTSHASETMNDETDEVATRPPGVKASKGLAKNKAETEYQRKWNIKKEDMAMRDRLLQMKLLDNLLAKTEPLAEDEAALKSKFITELLS
uniref:Uncharacterized protein n=1 Tax=Brassica oleracea var. oleracea TaxID=109376 RepID=A0A0D3A6V2_BRAOL